MADISFKLGFIGFGLFMLFIGYVWLNRSNNEDEDDDHPGLVHVGFGTYRTPEMCFWQAVMSFIVGSIFILIGIFI